VRPSALNLQQVHLRINDAATGQPTPVRLRITDADGTYYAPYGRLTEFATGVNQHVGGNVQIGAKKWAYIDGTCEILLPPGLLHIEIAKGPEYKPIDEETRLLAGKMSLRFTIERWSDVRELGWYSGDTRVHFMSPDAALLEGQAEDVAVVNLLAMDTGIEKELAEDLVQIEPAPETWVRFQALIERAIKGSLTVDEAAELRTFADVAATFMRIKERWSQRKRTRAIQEIISFSGQSFARRGETCGVVVNTHNRHLDMGSLSLLHCHRVVYPLNITDTDHSEWTMRDWCGQCHRKKGLVVWSNSLGLVRPSPFGEPLADLILGETDAFEISDAEGLLAGDFAMYDKLCRAELILPLVAGSGKQSNQEMVGGLRTYALCPADQAFTYSNWIEAVRAGRTFVSNGPSLQLAIDGVVAPPGMQIEPGGAPLQIHVEAKNWHSLERLELLWNGEVVAESIGQGGKPSHATLEHQLAVHQSGYLIARCCGNHWLAQTSAVAIRRVDAPGWAQPAAVQNLLGEIDAMLGWATEKKSPRLGHVLEEARTVLAKKLSSD
jgi:hypothetical protein